MAEYEAFANAYTRKKFGMASSMPPLHVEVRCYAAPCKRTPVLEMMVLLCWDISMLSGHMLIMMPYRL